MAGLIKKILLFLPFVFLFSPLLSFSKDGNNYHIKAPAFSTPPKIDGELENPIWLQGAVLEHFTQYEPVEGARPSEKTVTYIGYDKNNLYIAVRCFDSNPKAIRACLTQRDEVYGDDEVTIYLDTFNDKKKAFAFQVNPCGVQSDGIYTEVQTRGRGHGGGPERIDKSWDTFFITDAHRDDEGYTVELSIPFKSLRFPHSQTQVWGLQIKRNIRRKNEEIYWYPRSRDINGFLVQSGRLVIDGALEKGKNLEIMPVLIGLQERHHKFDPEVGLNLKYGITSELTGDLTYNPDFSQVEADMPQIDVNQRYALYYPEKRPFFLEGKDDFNTPLELVYTRKIADPLWGGKLTGKIGKTTLGFLSTYDLSPPEIKIEYDLEEEETDEDALETEGEALINVFRLKRDLFSESYVGLIFTDKERGSSWSHVTKNYNRVAGVDGHLKFLNNYRFAFQVVGSKSKVETEETAIIPAMSFNLSRTGRHLSFSLDYTHIPPDFEASLGFFRRKDIRSLSTRLSYAFLPQNDLIVDIRPSIEYQRIYDFNDILTDEEFQVGIFMSGWRGSHVWANLSNELERYEGVNFRKKSFRISLSSSPFSWLSGNINFSLGDSIYYDENPYLGYKTSIGARVTFKPLTNLRLFYNIRNDIFDRAKGGERVYKVNIISQRITYQLSRPLSLRLITDYNDYYKEIYTSILLSYEHRPGTVFYLGIDDNQERDESGIYRVTGRYYFIKFSYWWRI